MKFGIIGTNWITEKMLNAGNEIKNFEIGAIYSRTEERAKEIAKKYNVDKIFTNLDEMAKSDVIDAVYIATPNALHFSQSVLFLKNKKAVLCEKPATSNAKEFKELIKIAKENNTLYMEAMKIPFVPTYIALKENLHKIGKVRKITAGYCQYSLAYDNYLKGDIQNSFKIELSSSSLLDIGIYPLFLVVSLFGNPKEIIANGKVLENGKGIDTCGTLNLIYDEKDAIISYSKICTSYNPAEIMGENGMFLIEHLSEMDRLYFIDRRSENKK